MRSCEKCGNAFSSWARVAGRRRNLSSRKHCLLCVPFGEGTSRAQPEATHPCVLCGKLTEGRRRRCGSCNTKIRRYRTKAAAIRVLGGCCVDCGWSGHQAGFQFHHVADDKDFTIGDVANRSWKVILRELKKCVLLCAICHAVRHSTREDVGLIAEAEKYLGTLLLGKGGPHD
jgi:hypothetical protein